jgi:hypothetical protein
MRNGGAGTERVFEMLPFFANRATLESVYLQASVLSPAAFYVQSLISKAPSCPFGERYPCAHWNLRRAESVFRLLGVGDIVLVTPELQKRALEKSYMRKSGEYGPWQIFDLKRPPPYVEVIGAPPSRISLVGWKDRFYRWLIRYTGKEKFLVAGVDEESSLELSRLILNSKLWQKHICHPNVKVDFNELQLDTNCPGRAHLLKFAYHPSWKASTGDKIHLISPGMMMIVPSETNVVLRFGESVLWRVCSWVSFISYILLFCYLLVRTIIYCAKK